MNTFLNFLRTYRWVIIGTLAVFLITGFLEFFMGRLPLGPDGKFGLWEGNIWSSEQSQRFADPYSFSHIIHGMIFYWFLWLVARKMPIKYRFVCALALEACWELLENSPLIINRYREATIAQGYVGDSIFNSLSDIVMVAGGFAWSYFAKPSVTVTAIIIMEIATLLWVRDNLTLNVVMLIYPFEAIKLWQFAGRPM